MRTTNYICLILLIASHSLCAADSKEKNKLITLTNYQMDSVTAGSLNLSVTALATTLGTASTTYTSTYTNVFNRGVVEIGYGRGEAFACCGPYSETAVQTEASADGRIVLTKTRGFTNKTPQFSYTLSTIFVLSVNKPGDLNFANSF